MCLPLFLCMPLWVDTIFFDLCARTLMRGGVLYREVFTHALPGMFWIQVALRSLLGWRSETLRAVDFLIVSACVWLLVGKLQPGAMSWAWRLWTAFTLFAF